MKPFRWFDVFCFGLAFALTRWLANLPNWWAHEWIGGFVASVPMCSWLLLHWALVDWNDRGRLEAQRRASPFVSPAAVKMMRDALGVPLCRLNGCGDVAVAQYTCSEPDASWVESDGRTGPKTGLACAHCLALGLVDDKGRPVPFTMLDERTRSCG